MSRRPGQPPGFELQARWSMGWLTFQFVTEAEKLAAVRRTEAYLYSTRAGAFASLQQQNSFSNDVETYSVGAAFFVPAAF